MNAISDTTSQGPMTLPDIIAEIDRNGYCILKAHYGIAKIRTALDLLNRIYETARHKTASDYVVGGDDAAYVWKVESKDVFFVDMVLDEPLIRAALMHYLNDPWYRAIPQDKPNYVIRAMIGRSSRKKPLLLHIDSMVPYLGSHVFVIQVFIALQDQTSDNGGTVLIPGSHLSGDYAPQDALEAAVDISLRAGDILLLDSRTWHGARANQTQETRWLLVTTFCRWWLKQQFQTPQMLPAEIYAKLDDEKKSILGYCSIPFADEAMGINMKRGYDSFD